MSNEEPEDYGPPPDVDEIAELLTERYPVKNGERLRVTAQLEPLPGLISVLEGARDRFQISIEYLRGAGERDPWMVLIDAADALFGTLIESGRDYRNLPQGDDVEYDRAFFRVRVTRDIPELSLKADRLLGETN